LEIPKEFTIENLSDGSPVMQFVDNGLAVEIDLIETQLNASFTLQTFNSTLLPKRYTLAINSSTIHYSCFVSPRWPFYEDNNQVGGGAATTAGSNPYITKFYAYDSEKGENVHVKTWIKNPGYLPKYLRNMRYKIFADDYWASDTFWEAWTPFYSENKYILEGYTYVVHDYLDYIFTGYYSGNHYALNIGNLEPDSLIEQDYKIKIVQATGTGWFASYAPGTLGEFDVTPPTSGTHVVFVAHLVDQAFRNQFDENAWFDDLETQIFSYYGQDKYLWGNPFLLNFESQVFSWSPQSTDLDELFDYLYRDAEEIIGLSDWWVYSQLGTDKMNNGFDLLVGSVYQTNSGGEAVGISDVLGNRGLMMKGGFSELHTTMHEVLHTFGCVHVEYFGGWIMYDDTWWSWPAWVLSGNTGSDLLGNISHYDGLE
jgi:hypothetical protein